MQARWSLFLSAQELESPEIKLGVSLPPCYTHASPCMSVCAYAHVWGECIFCIFVYLSSVLHPFQCKVNWNFSSVSLYFLDLIYSLLVTFLKMQSSRSKVLGWEHQASPSDAVLLFNMLLSETDHTVFMKRTLGKGREGQGGQWWWAALLSEYSITTFQPISPPVWRESSWEHSLAWNLSGTRIP